MNVNLTLVIQGINFAIAYVFFRYILLAPLVSIIQKDHSEVENKKKFIFDLEEQILKKREYKKNRWNLLQKSFLKSFPDKDQVCIKKFKTTSCLAKPFIDKKEVEKLTVEVKAYIIQKVEHAV